MRQASFNPFLSTFLLLFFHWKPACTDALGCSLGLFLRPSLLAIRLSALDRLPEADLSPEARMALGEFREAERRRREYCERRF